MPYKRKYNTMTTRQAPSYYKKFNNYKKRYTNKKYNMNTTSLAFKESLSLHQPVPDEYWCWLTASNQGALNVGNANNHWEMSLNTLQYPFNVLPPGGGALPNPAQAVATWNPTGFTNIISNPALINAGGVYTGLYYSYRVWAAEATVTYMPTTAVDSSMLTMAPLGQGILYGSTSTQIQSPNSCFKLITAGVSSDANTLKCFYSIPEILGVPKKNFASLSGAGGGTAGVWGTGPTTIVFLQVRSANATGANNANTMGINVTVRYHVQFFGRVDVNLSER
jgi:hypothetical protein